MSRRPVPTQLKIVTGNPGKRAINKKEPKPARVIPPCPEHLAGSGKEAWAKLSVMLDGMGVMTEADALALERLVDCYTDIMECRQLIERDGRTYTSESQGGTLIKTNPAVNQLRAADAQFKSYLVEFGLTPAARSKVNAETPDGDEEKDPLNQFFG